MENDEKRGVSKEHEQDGPPTEAENAENKDSKGCNCRKDSGHSEKNKACCDGCEPPEQSKDSRSESGEDVLKKLEDAEKRAADNFDKFQRTLAEFDNFRKRMIKEKSAAYDDGAIAILNAILPIIDNFERALISCTDEEKKSAFFTGIEMIYRQLIDAMVNVNMTPIQTKGEKFNPNIHSAIAHIDDKSYGEGEIIEDMQKGYMYKDKVLRHSMVKVAN